VVNSKGSCWWIVKTPEDEIDLIATSLTPGGTRLVRALATLPTPRSRYFAGPAQVQTVARRVLCVKFSKIDHGSG
jgi:hypothetical protein